MNERVTALTKMFETFLAEVVEMNRQILAEANAQREEMNDLIGRMMTTRTEMSDLAHMYDEAGTTLVGIAEDLDDITVKIEDAFSDPVDMCPDIPYENLEGFCEDCGSEITVDDNYRLDDDGSGLLCEVCASDN